MTMIIGLSVAFALGYGAYRIIRSGFRYPQSEKLSGFGVLGYIVMIVLCVWLVATAAHRFF